AIVPATVSETFAWPRSSPYSVASVRGANLPPPKSFRSFESRKIERGATTGFMTTNKPKADAMSNPECFSASSLIGKCFDGCLESVGTCDVPNLNRKDWSVNAVRMYDDKTKFLLRFRAFERVSRN